MGENGNANAPLLIVNGLSLLIRETMLARSRETEAAAPTDVAMHNMQRVETLRRLREDFENEMARVAPH